MTLSDLQILIGSLTNDPNHDRYTTTDIGTELDNSMETWNVEAKLIKDTPTITVVAGTHSHSFSGVSGTIISVLRAWHKGIPLTKRSKAYLNSYYGGSDWLQIDGTPTDFYMEVTDPLNQYIVLFPRPTDSDAGPYLVVDFMIRHTSMSASTDVPFMSGTDSNPELRPYDWGLAYDAASRLLARDPSPENSSKAANYAAIARVVRANVTQVFKALEAEEPPKLKMPVHWRRRS